MHNLSLRLETIASLVPEGARVCDVGTDHGYLAIELMRRNIAKSVIAADISPSPLKNAECNIQKSGVKGIETRLCDGLSGISISEVDAVVIAGIGGEVIAGIIERGMNVAANKELSLILQPTTSPEILRKSLITNGFDIENETPVFENGKLYSVMLVRFSGKISKSEEFFYYVGKVSPDNHSGKLYIEKQLKRCLKCAQALKDIPQKKEEYLYYKGIADSICNHFKNHSFGE